ncbi:MAG: hypothetical protein DMG76_25140 [Acidobacteria bacterium]|nr:MAG: hypothetical protein DMG76_25140 [Acidobacteriota bacterium]
MASDFCFWGHNDVEKQVRMTVNQSGKQSRTAQIDRLDARRMRLYLRGRTYLLDLAIFNEHGCGRKHLPGPGIEHPGSHYQGLDVGRLGDDVSN